MTSKLPLRTWEISKQLHEELLRRDGLTVAGMRIWAIKEAKCSYSTLNGARHVLERMGAIKPEKSTATRKRGVLWRGVIPGVDLSIAAKDFAKNREAERRGREWVESIKHEIQIATPDLKRNAMEHMVKLMFWRINHWVFAALREMVKIDDTASIERWADLYTKIVKGEFYEALEFLSFDREQGKKAVEGAFEWLRRKIGHDSPEWTGP